jgi:hypothetical protein
MNCPYCLHDKSATILTIPANRRQDGKIYRRRKCKGCDKEFSTLEMYLQDAKDLQAGEGLPADDSLSSGRSGGPLVDIEDELEKMLQPSIASIHAVLTPGGQVSRQRVETAKWVIQDRRDQRKMLSDEQEGTEEQQLGNLLRLVGESE